MSSRLLTTLASLFALVWPVLNSARASSLSSPQTPANALERTFEMVASGVRSSWETMATKSSLVWFSMSWARSFREWAVVCNTYRQKSGISTKRPVR